VTAGANRKVTRIGAALREAGPADAHTPGGGHLPEDCPVIPLGIAGNVCHYLNAIGQYVAIEAKAHSKLTIYGLFGERSAQLIGPPQWAKGWDEDTQRPKDFAPDKVARDLIAACHYEGPWDAADRLRGRGAWRGEDDDLILHLGPSLQVRGTRERPGKRGRHVYTVQPPRPAPAREKQPAGQEGPAAELERLLNCWNWARGELDARLLLGWTCASFLCGALEWRPQAWIHGGRGCGKSTLIRLLAQVQAEGEGCVKTDDATAAGVRTRLQHDSLPVLFDESEPSEDMHRLNNLIELARLAASGGMVLRGTADHGSASFTVRFMGLFVSVLRPAMKAQDLSRVAFLPLRPLTGGSPPTVSEEQLRLLGQRLFRRMVDGWPRFLQVLPVWRRALMDAGLEARGADQFGTLLAAADVALADDAPDSDTLAEWADRLAAGTRADRSEEMPEWRRCLEHVTTKLAPQWRGGELQSIGRLIAVAAGRAVLRDEETGEAVRPGWVAMADANKALAAVGLRVEPFKNERGHVLRAVLDPATGQPTGESSVQGQGDMLGHLAVANNHTELSGIFRGTHWQGRSGTSGGWKPALEEAPGAIRHKEMRFGGAASRCVLVPLELVLDGDGEADGE
jgi:energy-coupling factor transporter ATP-binding protein EcfA2